MKCFTVNGERLHAGIYTTKDEKLGTVVFLGEAGRGRQYQKVALFRKAPAEVDKDGRIFDAHPIKITPDKTIEDRFFYALAKPNNNTDNRVLVRIDTGVVYTRGSNGHWSTKAGEPITLIKGYGAHGLAGRTASWDDGLVVMKPGDVVRVVPDGGHKTGIYALFFNQSGTLSFMPWNDYEAMTAVESAEKEEGGVQWL